MKSLSLIHAIVLLHEGERLSKKAGKGQLVRNAESIALAERLISQVLEKKTDRRWQGSSSDFLDNS